MRTLVTMDGGPHGDGVRQNRLIEFFSALAALVANQRQPCVEPRWWRTDVERPSEGASADILPREKQQQLGYIGWPLDGHWLAIAWPLASHWLAIAWLLLARWLSISWPLAGHWLAIGWPLAGHWLAIGWP